MSRRLASLFLFPCLLIAATAPAQTVDFDVLVDTDRSAATGCSVTPSGSAALSGFERRIRASVDLGSFEIIALEQSACAGAGFGAPAPVSGFATPYPLALNTGIGGADAVELAVGRAALGAANLNQLRLTFVADSGSGSDVLATTNGGAGGGPIVFGLPVQIPALSVWGLGALVLVLLALAWLAHRRLGRVGAVMAVMLVTTAAWAMTFALDGDLTDWGGRAPNATDPAGDATDGSAAIDLVAGFVVLDGGDLFFRMDVSDTENQAPVAVDDAFSTDEDTSLNIAAPGVLSNDSDAELDPISTVLNTGPANAQSFTLNADGSFDYVPNADFNGSDSFTYFANDGQADSAAATVTITVNAINDAPVAVDDVATTNEDTQVDIDVLANDSDVDGNLDPATVTVTSGPANGATAVNPATGIITYTKSGDFNGSDGFTYEVCDDGTPLPALCSSATVSIDVDQVNDAPSFTASNPPAVDEDAGPQTVSGWVTAFDPGPGEGGQSVLAYIVSNVSTPGLFSAGPVVDAAGNLNYTPATDAFGSSTFDVAVRDDGGTANGGTDTSPTQTFTITVNPVDDPPVAVDDTATVAEDDPATAIDVLANDGDIDGGPISITSVSPPANGTVVITGGGSGLTYEPDPNYCNDGGPTDDFTYTLNGGSFATVAVTVTCVNDPPVVTFPTAGVNFDPNVGPVSIDPAATLTDIDSTRFNRVETTLDIGGICDPLDTLAVQDQGAGAGQIGFDGVTVTFEGTAISTAVQPWACNDPGTGDQNAFIVQLDTNADQAATEALLRALRFSTTSPDSSARTANVVVADDANATGSAAQTITLIRAPIANNDGPFNVPAGDPLNLPAGTLFNDNGSGADDRGLPLADVESFGGGDLGGSVADNLAGTSASLAGGTLQVNADGSLSLTGTSVAGTVTFGYRLTNAAGSDDASVTIIIEQAPTANDDTVAPASNPGDAFHTALDVPLSPVDGSPEDLDANDDLGGPAATIASFGAIQTNDGAGAFNAPAGTVTTNPQGNTVTPLPNYPDGSLVVNGNGTYTFTPPADYAGLFAFAYRLSNSAGTSDATVTLAVGNRAACTVDAYTGTANIDFDVNAPGGILANDTGSSILVSQSMGSDANVGNPAATTNGGSVTLNADGSFDYSPPAGVSGANVDSFTYAIENGFGEVTTNCTANITLNTDAGAVPWFISGGAGGANVGTFADPFTSIAAFNAANDGTGNNPGDGDIVYVVASLPGFYNEADGINLRSAQEVYGGTVQFNTVFTASGNTSTAYNSFAATTEGGRTEIRTTGDDAFDIASNNTIRGFTVDSTVGYAFADSGGNIGNTTISDVSTFNNGGVFNLQNGGTINATLDRMSASVSSGGLAVIALNGIAGSISDTTPGGIIYSGNGNVFDIRNGAVSVTVSSPVTRTAGTGTGIFLSNADGVITFSGVLDIQSGTAGINVENGSDGSLGITNVNSGIRGIQGIPFRVNNSAINIDYDGDINHRQGVGSLLSARTVEIIGGTGTISLDGETVTGDNVNQATAESVFLSNTGSANTITFNSVDAIMRNAPVFVSQTSGNVAMNRLRGRCDGDLSISGDTHCVQITDTTSSGFTIEAMTADLDDAGEFGGALSLNNTPGTWTVEDISGGLTGRNEEIVFGRNFGTLNIATVNSGTSPGGLATGGVIGNNQPAFDLENGAINIASRSVSAFPSGGTLSTGIRLVNTTGAGFTVTGDGSAANNQSGGVIESVTTNAIQLTNTTAVTLNQMRIGQAGALANVTQNGIRAESVDGLTVRNTDFINASGDDTVAGNDFAAIRVLSPIAGSDITLTGNLFQRSFEDHVRIENGNSTMGGGAVLATVTVEDNSFDDNDASGQGNDAFLYLADNGSDATINVIGNSFFNSDGDHVQIALNGTASADVAIGGPGAGDGNVMTSNGAGNVLGSGITFSSGQGAGATPFSGTLTYLIQGNDIQDAVAAAINVNLTPSSTAGLRYSGSIDANMVGASGDGFSGGFGIIVNQNGAGTLNATISNNTIRQYDGDHGLLLQARDGSGRLNAEVTGNSIAEPADVFVFDGLGINAGATSTDTSVVCADVRNNTLTGASGTSSGGADFGVFTTSGAPMGPTVILPGYGGMPKDGTAVVGFVQSQNVGAPSGVAFFSGNSVGVLGTGTSCL